MYTFPLDVPTDLVSPRKVIKYPAHPGNMGYPVSGDTWAQRWRSEAGELIYEGRPNVPKAAVIHTVEEDADDYEAAPVWFASAQAPNSMHFYGDDDGDLYQMVAVRHPAWGHGTGANNTRQPRPTWFDGYSYNTASLGYELEGRAAELTERWAQYRRDHGAHHPQRVSLVRWLAWVSHEYGFPLDRMHVKGHEELTIGKSDPGIELYGFPIDDVIADARALLGQPDESQNRAELWVAAWRSGWAVGHDSGVQSARDLLAQLAEEDSPTAPTPNPPLEL